MNSHGDENWLREILLTKLRVFNNLTRDQLVAKTPLEIQSIIGDPRLEELLLQNITYSLEKRSELTELIRQWNPNVSQPQTNPLEQFDSLLDSLSSNSEVEPPPSIEQLPSMPQLPSDPSLLTPEPITALPVVPAVPVAPVAPVVQAISPAPMTLPSNHPPQDGLSLTPPNQSSASVVATHDSLQTAIAENPVLDTTKQQSDAIEEEFAEFIVTTAHIDIRSGKNKIKSDGMTKAQLLFSGGKKEVRGLYREMVMVGFSSRGITISTIPKKTKFSVSLITVFSKNTESKLRIFTPWNDVINYAAQLNGKYNSMCIETKSAFISMRAGIGGSFGDEEVTITGGGAPKGSLKLAHNIYDSLGIKYNRKIMKKNYSEGVCNYLASVLNKYQSMGLMTDFGISIDRICVVHQLEKRYFENTGSYHCRNCDPTPFEKLAQDRINDWLGV